MKSLKQARKSKIEDFIKEHETDPDGDLDKLDALIKRPSQGSGGVGEENDMFGVRIWRVV
jgi:hypothetical protein